MPFLFLLHPRVRTLADTATVYVDIQVISEEAAEYADTATVYIDIQPGFIFLQIDFVLEIVGDTTRWSIAQPESRMQIDREGIAEIVIADMLVRWAILETRRYRWRS